MKKVMVLIGCLMMVSWAQAQDSGSQSNTEVGASQKTKKKLPTLGQKGAKTIKVEPMDGTGPSGPPQAPKVPAGYDPKQGLQDSH